MSGEVEIIEVQQPTQPKVIARSSCDQRVRLATCVDSSKTMPWLLRKGMSTKGISGFSCRWIIVLYSSIRRLRSLTFVAAGFNGPIEVAAVASKCFSWPLCLCDLYEVPAPHKSVKSPESKVECLFHGYQHFSLIE